MKKRTGDSLRKGVIAGRKKKIGGIVFFIALFTIGLLPADKWMKDDPSKILQEMKEKFRQVADYTCRMQVFSANRKKSRTDLYQFFFKKPKQLRVEVIGGSNNGSVLLFQDGGHVRVKQAKGLASLLTLTFKPTHPWVCNLRGFGLHQSDWGWLIEEHIQFFPYLSVRAFHRETLDDRPALVMELVSSNPEKTLNMARELLWIDDQWRLPLKYLMYDESGKLIQSMFCWDVQINPGLPDDLFVAFDINS